MNGTAIISEDEKYRYLLTRELDPFNPRGKIITWIMLNPSTADAEKDDPTIRRVIWFTKRENGTLLQVINLFAYRCTNPNELPNDEFERIGPDWIKWTANTIENSNLIIAAWGANAKRFSRSHSYLEPIIYDRQVYCLGLTKGGFPRHPLYVNSKQQLVPFCWQ